MDEQYEKEETNKKVMQLSVQVEALQAKMDSMEAFIVKVIHEEEQRQKLKRDLAGW